MVLFEVESLVTHSALLGSLWVVGSALKKKNLLHVGCVEVQQRTSTLRLPVTICAAVEATAHLGDYLQRSRQQRLVY